KVYMKLLIVVYILLVAYCLLCPFTKVEESFNLQACHDMLHHFLDLDQYDHLEFPGVVPRTFLGALIVSSLAKPVIWCLSHWIEPPMALVEQCVVRCVLGALVVGSLVPWHQSIQLLFGRRAAMWSVILTCCQFHFCFWSTRTLPNMFALPLVMLGLSHWVRSIASQAERAHHQQRMIDYLAIAGIIFRFEAGVLLMVLLFYQVVIYRTLSAKVAIPRLILTSTLALACTVMVDSWFWQRWVWPEGEGFYFNAVLNKSHEWGTLPWYGYVALFLPRVLLTAYPRSLVAWITVPHARPLLLPCWTFIALFSLLPHKEWRFIIYMVPVLTSVAGAVTAQQWNPSRSNGGLAKNKQIVLRLLLCGELLCSLAIAWIMVYVSSWNYPGGHALAQLHALVPRDEAPVRVHLDVKTAMTGAARFGQWHQEPTWLYSKDESHTTLD
ncbi:hypothetical protein DM01DRAFT_1259294, partial [Hesseltinella vesiculosa]